MKSRSRKLIGVLILSIFLIGIGYAFLSSTLTINGIGAFSKNSWLIYFDEIRPAAGSVETASQPAIITNPEKTNIQFDVDLNTPGDFYEFDVYIKNDGTIDAMIDEVIMPELTEEQKKYMKFSYTYVDGTRIKKCDELKAQNFRDTRLRVEYLEDADLDIMPEEGLTHFDVTITYVQESECELDKIDVELDPNGGIYNETTEVTTITLSDGQEYTVGVPTREGYTFIKWNEITDSNSYSDDKVTFKGKNVRLRAEWQVSDDVVARIDREESIYYVTIQAAIDDARDNEMIHLLKNTSEVFTNNKNVTLNLEGYKVTGSGTNEEGYSLTIINGIIENTDGVGFVNKGTLTLGINDNHLCDVGDKLNICLYDEGFISLLGTSLGLKQEGTFNFYDGFVEGKVAIEGEVNDTPVYISESTGDPEHYNVFVDHDDIRNDQKAYLTDKVTDAVSKTIDGGNIYYLNLQDNIITSEQTGYKIYAVRNFEAAYLLTIKENSSIIFDIVGYNVRFGNNLNDNGNLKLMNSDTQHGKIDISHAINLKGIISFDNIEVNVIGESANLIDILDDSTINGTNSKLTSLSGAVISNKADTLVNLDDNTELYSSKSVTIKNEFPSSNTNYNLEINGGVLLGYSTVINSRSNLVVNGSKSYDKFEHEYIFISTDRGTTTVSNVTIEDSNYLKSFISGGTIDASNNYIKSNKTNGYLFDSNAGEIKSGTYIKSGTSPVLVARNVLSITGGTFSGKNGIYVERSGILKLYDAIVDGEENGVRLEGNCYGHGEAFIYGGVITGGVYGIYAQNDCDALNKLELGIDDDEIKMSPVITGGTYGIYQPYNRVATSIINYYDGTLKGQTAGYNMLTKTATNTTVVNDSEIINEENYVVNYLISQENYIEYNGNTYNSINSMISENADITVFDAKVINNAYISDSQTIPSNITINLDLNGNTLLVESEIINKGTFVIDDSNDTPGTIKSSSSIIFNNNGYLTINKINILQEYQRPILRRTDPNNGVEATTTFNDANINSVYAPLATISYNHKFYMTGGTLVDTGSENTFISGLYNNNLKFTLNSGTVDVKAPVSAHVIINDGEFIMDKTFSKGSITMNGGYLHNRVDSQNGMTNSTKIIMNDGIIENKIDNSSSYIFTNGEINMAGGSLISSGKGSRETYDSTITGGIIKTVGNAFELSSGKTLTIGEDDSTIKTNTPVIISGDIAVKKNSGKLFFLDGILKGKNESYNGTIDRIPDIATVVDTEKETIDEIEYKIAYLQEKVAFLQVGEQTYRSFNDIVSTIDDDEIDVIVIENGEINYPQDLEDKRINLNLNGKTITVTQSITVNNYLEITDSSDDHTGKIVSSVCDIIVNNGETTLLGGTLKLDTPSSWQYRAVVNGGVFTINGEHSLITNEGSNPSSRLMECQSNDAIFNMIKGNIYSVSYVIYSGNNSRYNKILNMSGGTITAPGAGSIIDTININMTGGLIKSKGSINNCSTIMSGGKIESASTAISSGIFNMTGGLIEAEVNGVSGANIDISNGTIRSNKVGLIGRLNGVITGGTIIGGTYGINLDSCTITFGENDSIVSNEQPIIIGNTYALYNSYAIVNYYDGIFKGKVDGINTNNEKYVTVSDTISSIPNNMYIKSDFEEVEEDGETVNYYINYLEEIHDFVTNSNIENSSYRDFNLAISEATAGDTLELIANADEFDEIIIDKNITIDLKGFNIMTTHSFVINEGVEVNFINTSNDDSMIYLAISSIDMFTLNGTLNINNVDIKEHFNNKGVFSNTADANLIITNINAYNTHFQMRKGSITLNNVQLNANGYIRNEGSGLTTISDSEIACSTYVGSLQLSNSTFNGLINAKDAVIDELETTSSVTVSGESTITNTNIIGNELYIQDSTTLDNLYFERIGSTNSRIVVQGKNEEIVNNWNNITMNVNGNYRNQNVIYLNKGIINATNLNINSINSNTGDFKLIDIYDGTFNYISGTARLSGTKSYGVVTANESSIFTMGVPEPINGENYGKSTANVSTTNPTIEAIGSTYGYAVYNNNGFFNFYDGKIIGSTKARYKDGSSGVEYNWEIREHTDEETGYNYCIIEFMKS